MDLAGPGDVIPDPQGRMDQGQQFGLSLDGTEDCQPQHRLTGGVFGAVSKDDADAQDQQSLTFTSYRVLYTKGRLNEMLFDFTIMNCFNELESLSAINKVCI